MSVISRLTHLVILPGFALLVPSLTLAGSIRLYQKDFEPAPEAAAIAQTPEQFAATFVPTQGRHEVVLVHPLSQQPVRVWFTLPSSRCVVSAAQRHITMLGPDFGRIEIWFKPNGRLTVERYRGAGPSY